jgi:hypothetical protein
MSSVCLAFSANLFVAEHERLEAVRDCDHVVVAGGRPLGRHLGHLPEADVACGDDLRLVDFEPVREGDEEPLPEGLDGWRDRREVEG